MEYLFNKRLVIKPLTSVMVLCSGLIYDDTYRILIEFKRSIFFVICHEF
jgi:hypothetical protein